MPVKPAPGELGLDVSALNWRGSGKGAGTIEVAFVTAHGADWVLLRVRGDTTSLISVFSRFEWDCFLDGARKGEFDDAAR
jgi:hypothetical protein